MKYSKYILVILIIIIILFYAFNQMNTKNISESKSNTQDSEENIIDVQERSDIEKIEIDFSKYTKPSDDIIKENLTDLQYKVTQKEGTEKPFDNKYYDNYELGIYVDIVTGEPLFFSTDKYKSDTGWPSFTKPISLDVITFHEDNKLLSTRIEVKSKVGKSHLGHVFNDGPIDDGGLRYCLNSSALKFIPYDKMKISGYKELIEPLDKLNSIN
ncbi:MAG: peptide-methionine (R)-S-oxide reductase MsrB [Bacillota bacterium]